MGVFGLVFGFGFEISGNKMYWVGVGDADSMLTYVSRGTIVLGKWWELAYAKVISNANILSSWCCVYGGMVCWGSGDINKVFFQIFFYICI